MASVFPLVGSCMLNNCHEDGCMDDYTGEVTDCTCKPGWGWTVLEDTACYWREYTLPLHGFKGGRGGLKFILPCFLVKLFHGL